MHDKWQYVGESPTEHPHISIHTWNIIGSGACQCYKDCDCYKERGKYKGQAFKWSHPFATYQDGTVKKYETLKACMDSLKSKIG